MDTVVLTTGPNVAGNAMWSCRNICWDGGFSKASTFVVVVG